MIKDTTVIVANYLHPHFTKECVESIRKYYPFIPIVIVDDCSSEPPSFNFEDVMYKRLDYHMGHGIALDCGMERVETKYVITIDHDVALIKEGAFEYLFSFMKNEYVAGVGKHKNNQSNFPFISPHFALWRADLIKQYKLSFSELSIENNQSRVYHFAVAQLLCARIEKMFGYDLIGGADGIDYIKKIGYAKYPTTQHDYKIKRNNI